MTKPQQTEQPEATLKRPDFERIALLLQGGGALGAYQGGVYQALSEADLHPTCIAGISIGAINAAIIAGNAPERRVDALRAFWEQITTPLGFASLLPYMIDPKYCDDDFSRGLINQTYAFSTLLGGALGFFAPRHLPPFFYPTGRIEKKSFYDVSPLKETLERMVDFDRLNSGDMRFSVGAVNVRTGNFEYFDTRTHTIRPEHIMASGALPPGFPAVEIDGEYYWDGGLVSNTPLQWILETRPREDTLAFQVDLWSAHGELPGDLAGLDLRQKDIRFSSRTRANTDSFKKSQRLRRALHRLFQMVPEGAVADDDIEMKLLQDEADEKVYNIVHLIYRAKAYEASSKDYEFSRMTMEDHWASGYKDTLRTLSHPEILDRPATLDGVLTFDLAQER